MTLDEQIVYLTKGAEETIRPEELRAKLEQSAKSGKKLRVYLGVDPTAPDIHLGHTVVLRKLKHFQDLGHTAIFLIGDFSAMIGDPTGQSETRPPLEREEVDANAKTYLEQVYKILDREKTEVRYNSEWLGKMTSYEIIRLAAKYPLARMLEREDFRARLAGGWKGQLFRTSEEMLGPREGHQAALKFSSSSKASLVKRPSSMAIHELLYPLLTALDAVELKSDVELGATEQKFNLLVHREIQREYGLAPQVILTMPILEGLDGVKKMSKSLGNYVGINEPPAEMFGKLMSITDELMWRYDLLLTDSSLQDIDAKKKKVASGAYHPFGVKLDLARGIVAQYYGDDAALKAAKDWETQFQDKGVDANAPLHTEAVPRGYRERLDERLVKLGLCSSKSEAQRQIKAGSARVRLVPGVRSWRRLSDVEVGRSHIRPRKNPADRATPPPAEGWTVVKDPTFSYQPETLFTVSLPQPTSLEIYYKVGRKQARVKFVFEA